ncbi:glycosyltransferase family 4 protein [Fusibacter sp. 3D3]|uniref:glycosyltransferase family 4 protein n=1 Tax=Fusibacter sp. 3D3 TaxID=1048380 RepID=UPI0008538B38|nr:glycosyltransferase family 4 protein [Fusibacter sp. 3D3]GAU77747.1 exopolysaccharide biosynthesis glycosyltransferase EpsF [Fusibacter sp. 3D3]
MKTKIVIISETIMDGVGRHIVDVIKHLDYSQIELTVIHSQSRLDYRFYDVKKDFQDQVTFYEVPELIREIHPKLDMLAFFKVYKMIKYIQPDIVHCHSSKAGVVGRLVSKFLGIKKILYTPHAYAVQNQTITRGKHLIYLYAEKILARIATTRTINVSECEKAFAVINGISKATKCQVVYNCVEDISVFNIKMDHALMNQKWKIPTSHLIVGTVARLYTQKNPHEFVKIAEQVCRQRPYVTFVWVGEGEYLEEMQSLVESLHIADRVLFLGHQRSIETFNLWFDIFLTSARYEGLPYTLIETMSTKTPIVASNVTGNSELVLPNVTGYLYELGRVEEAVKNIISLIDSEALRNQFGNEGYKFYKSHFTIDEMMRAYQELYKS